MKKYYVFIVLALFALNAGAQFIYTDFDDNQNVTFTGWPNVPLAISNPDPSGINTSANVGEWTRSTEQWAHVSTELDGKIDFSDYQMFTLKVWSPIACQILFKLEDKTNGSISTEVSQMISTPNQWEQLTFDFTGAASDTYDKIVIFFDFATTTNNVFYFDDVMGPEYQMAPPEPFIYTDFDDNQNVTFTGWPNVPATITNPDPSGINTSANVGEWERTTEQWAHISTTLDGKIDFSEFQVFSLKVWSPIACQILFKIEDKNNGAVFAEASMMITSPNQWEQLDFDFSGAASETYDKIVIFFDFAATNSNTFYFDDVTGPGYSGSGVKPLMALDIQDNFEDDGWGTVNEWNFQDPDLNPLVVTTDPVNSSNHVADYNRSGAFQYTNAQFILEHRMDLSERNKFDLKVYFPSSNDYTGSLTPTAAIKLQNSLLGPNAWTTQTEVKLDVTAFDEWVTLTFDFSAVMDSVNYDQVVVQLGGEGHNVPAQFYFDDLYLEGAIGIVENNVQPLSVYPNPARDIVSFQGIGSVRDLKVYDITGNQINLEYNQGNSLDISGLTDGLYVIRIVDENGVIHSSTIVKN